MIEPRQCPKCNNVMDSIDYEIHLEWELKKLSNRDNEDVFTKAIEKWREKQIDMLIEKSFELIGPLSLLGEQITKLKRQDENLSVEDLKTWLRGNQGYVIKLADEMADVEVVYSQFFFGFTELVKERYEFKLDRLKERLKE